MNPIIQATKHISRFRPEVLNLDYMYITINPKPKSYRI